MAKFENGTLSIQTTQVDSNFGVLINPDIELDFNILSYNPVCYVEFGYWLSLEKRDTVNNLVISHLGELIEYDDGTDEVVSYATVHFNGGLNAQNITVGELSTVFFNYFLDDDNPTSDEVTTVDGLTVTGREAFAYAGDNVHFTQVTVADGATFITDQNIVSRDFLIEDLSVNGGYVWLSAGTETETVDITAGNVFVEGDAAVGDVTVSDNGILYNEDNGSIESVTLSDGGLAVFNANPDVGPVTVNKGGRLVLQDYWNGITDVTVKSGGTIVFGNNMFNSETNNRGVFSFASGTVVGYGFNNALLTYTIDGRTYIANKTEARNYIVTYEDLTIGKGQKGINLTQDDGGKIIVDSDGTLEGANILINTLWLIGSQSNPNKIHATNIVMNDPYFEDFGFIPATVLQDTAVVNYITANGHSELEVQDNASACNVILNGNSTAKFFDYAQSINMTVNENAYAMAFNNSKLQSVTLNGGLFDVLGNSTAENITVNAGDVVIESSASDITITGGTVINSGSVSDITVSEGGRFVQMGWHDQNGVWHGAYVEDLTAYDGAWIVISSQEDIAGLDFAGTDITIGYNFNAQYAGADVNVSENFIVSYMKSYYIQDRQTAKNLCLSAGNDLVSLLDGARLEGARIENGYLTVNEGAHLAGNIDLYGETYYINDDWHNAAGITFYSDEVDIENANFNFMLGQNKQLDNYNENTDWTNLGINFVGCTYGMYTVTPIKISVTVDQELTEGEYSLYLGTGYVFDSITICDAEGEVLGEVSIQNKKLVSGTTTFNLVNLYNENNITNANWGLEVEHVEEVDVENPTISNIVASTTAPTHEKVVVTAVFADNSGKVTKKYRIDNGEWQNYSNGVEVYHNSKITFWAQDAAGNSTYEEYDVTNISPVSLEYNDVLTAYNGQNVWDVEINNGGAVYLNYGAQANSCTVNNGGALHVYSGAAVTSTTVNQSGYLGIGKGAVASNTTIGYAGELTVWGGGKVIDNTINTWGAIILSSGAVAQDTIVNSLGGLHVYSGAVASNTTIKEGGILGAGLGATVYDTTLDSFGRATLWGGAVASDTTIGYAAELTVLSGGLMDNGVIENWGAVILSSGAIGNFATVMDGGGYHIYNDAIAYSTEITSGAQLGIGSAGTLYNSELSNGASMTFYDESIIRGWHSLAGSVEALGDVDAEGAYINLDLTTRSTSQDALIEGFENFNDLLRLSAEVTGKQSGTFELVSGIAGFDEDVTLYVDGMDVGAIGIGESLTYASKQYTLSASNDTLKLSISKVSYGLGDGTLA